jgi:serine protease Do
MRRAYILMIVALYFGGCAEIPKEVFSRSGPQEIPETSDSSDPPPSQKKQEDGQAKEYSMTYDQSDHLKELVGAGRHKEALKLYHDNRETYFEKKSVLGNIFGQKLPKEKLSTEINLMVEKVNEDYANQFTADINKIKKHENWPAARETWETVKNDIKNSRLLLENYDNYPLLQEEQFHSKKYDSLQTEISKLIDKAKNSSARSFESHDILASEDFFDAYPVNIDNKLAFLDQQAEVVKTKLKKATTQQINAFSEKYEIGDGLKKALATNYYQSYLSENSQKNDLGGYGFEEIIKAVRATRDSGYALEEIPNKNILFIDATSKALLSEGRIEFPPEIKMDIPFPSSKSDLENALGSKANAKHLIVFEVAQASTKRRIQKREKLRSQFLAGYRDVPNPEYNQALLNVQQKQMALSNQHSQICLNDAYGLCALGKAFAVMGAKTSLNEANQRFSETTQYIKEPVLKDYEVSISNLETTKFLTVNYYVIDIQRKKYFKSIFDVSESKNFKLIYNLDERDTEKDYHLRLYDTEEKVSSFEDKPVTVKISSLLTHYLENKSDLHPFESEEALRQVMLKDKNVTLAKFEETKYEQKAQIDARFESVVVIYNPTGALGTGFYVKPNLVLTNYHVIEGAKFAELKLHNGMETFGKVVKSDVRLDLALIKVEAQGKPVQFYDSNDMSLGKTVEAIGHPNGLEFTITRGIISAIRKKQSVFSTGGKEVLFIQTDTPINPGNSGGPLFLGDKVIGINDWKIVKTATEGLGFSIHFSEAKEFLKDEF